MNGKKNYDFLSELAVSDDEKAEELAYRYPVLDKSAKRRIAILCEEKLNMKDDRINIYETDWQETVDNVEVIRKTPWYRRPAFSIAASLVILLGAAGGVMAVFGGQNVEPMSTSDTGEMLILSDKQNVVSEELQSYALELSDAFTKVESLYHGITDKDDMQKITYNNAEYAKVTEERFGSTDDVKELMEKYFTESFITSRYPDMFEDGSSAPRFIDSDGGLYVNLAETGYYGVKGCLTTPEIYNITETAAEMKYLTFVGEDSENGENSEYIIFQLVTDGENFKINSFKTESVKKADSVELAKAEEEWARKVEKEVVKAEEEWARNVEKERAKAEEVKRLEEEAKALEVEEEKWAKEVYDAEVPSIEVPEVIVDNSTPDDFHEVVCDPPKISVPEIEETPADYSEVVCDPKNISVPEIEETPIEYPDAVRYPGNISVPEIDNAW